MNVGLEFLKIPQSILRISKNVLYAIEINKINELDFISVSVLECTSPNVWPHDSDVFIAVIAGLLVYESEGVHEFMRNDSNTEARRFLERHRLSPATSTQVRPTPGFWMMKSSFVHVNYVHYFGNKRVTFLLHRHVGES